MYVDPAASLQTPLNLAKWIPSRWFESPQKSSVWVAAYRMLRVSPQELADGPKCLDFAYGQVHALLVQGPLSYISRGQAHFAIDADNQLVFARDKLTSIHSQPEAWLLLLMPYVTDGEPAKEADLRTRERTLRKAVDTVTGLLAAFYGRNIAFEKVFDNVMSAQSGQLSYFHPSIQYPMTFPRPNLSDKRLMQLSQLNTAIESMSEADQLRTCLSLRLFRVAVIPDDPSLSENADAATDAFLRFWLALEALVFTEPANPSALVQLIAQAYQLKGDPFQVELLWGLRNRLVIQGENGPIHPDLLRYMEALYTDALFARLNLPSERRTEFVLHSPNDRRFSFPTLFAALDAGT